MKEEHQISWRPFYIRYAISSVILVLLIALHSKISNFSAWAFGKYDQMGLVAIIGAAVALMFWVAYSSRCPRCNYRPLEINLRNGGAKCPACGCRNHKLV